MNNIQKALSLSSNKAIVVLIFVMASISIQGCGPDMSPEYGIYSIALPDGRDIYVKRMVWGLNGDVLVISPNREYCHMPDAATDYIFHNMDAGWSGFYYKVENDTLVIYAWIKAEEPQGGTFPIKVVQHGPDLTEYNQIKENPGKPGLKYVQVETDKSLKCN
jgi:hypothetical protein